MEGSSEFQTFVVEINSDFEREAVEKKKKKLRATRPMRTRPPQLLDAAF